VYVVLRSCRSPHFVAIGLNLNVSAFVLAETGEVAGARSSI
jgi:hypothetical protein